MIVEGKQERIDEKNPVKALGIQIRSKSDTVREAGFDVQLIQNAVPICGAARSFGGLLLVNEPLRMLGLEVVIGITEERLGRGYEFGIVVAQTNDGTLIGGSGLRIHVRIAGKSGMRMIVVDGNAIDLREQVLVSFLDVAAGEGFSLRMRRRCGADHRERNGSRSNPWIHRHPSNVSYSGPESFYC